MGTGSGAEPDPQNIRSAFDNYLAQAGSGSVMYSVWGSLLTDATGSLRWPGAGPVRTTPAHAFTLDNPGRWFLLYQWLRD